MPRPISWLSRVHQIRKAVAGSSRSHWDRSEIEEAFGLQPRAARLLIEALPTTSVGTSRLVGSEALTHFLDGVAEAEFPAAFIDAQRAATRRTSRRSLRTLVRSDLPTASLGSLPANLSLETGRITVTFSTVEELAQTLFSFAQILEFEGEAFVERFEPKREQPTSPQRNEVANMFAELISLEELANRSLHVP